jgi:hypothetical protein
MEVNEQTIGGVCNSLNAQSGLSRRIYLRTGDKRELTISVIMQQAQIVISTLERRLDSQNKGELIMINGQGDMETNKDGFNRESNKGRGRFDLLPYEALEAAAIWYEQGADKYGERNWEKGCSVKDCINRMIRHSIKAGNGMTDEDHLAAVIWNACTAISMMKRRPDMNDHVWHESKEDS